MRNHSFTRAVITGGLLSLAVAVADTHAAPVVTAQATQATPDAELVAKIRKAIGDDKTIAAYAETLKIIASDGLVSLKGDVKSDADKKAIGQKADDIAGAKNVMNNLLVTS
ncbi:MAG: BON domain-containing protein [Vicinamibacteraceae bacterium]